MRSPFALTVLALSIIASGCASQHQPVDLGAPQPTSLYSDRVLDSLGGQRYTEEQMIYRRKIEAYETQLQDLEQKRQALEASLGVSQIEAGQGSIRRSDDEATRMTDYAEATFETQVRLARETGQHAVERSLIENERDRRLMEAEIEANRKLAALSDTYASGYSSLDLAKEGDRLRSQAEERIRKIQEDSRAQLQELELEYSANRQRLSAEEYAQSRARAQAAALDERRRLTLVVANAESARRVRSDLEKSELTLRSLERDRDQAESGYRSQIADLQSQIRSIELEMGSKAAEYEGRIDAQRQTVAALRSDLEELNDLGESLLPGPTEFASNAPTGSAGEATALTTLEAGFSASKDNIQAKKIAEIAAVNRDLQENLQALKEGAVYDSRREADVAAIQAELARQQTEITNAARSEIAALEVKTEVAKAQVVAPVVTSRAVYAGEYTDEPQRFSTRRQSRETQVVAAPRTAPQAPATQPTPVMPPAVAVSIPEDQEPDPILVVSTFKPEHERPIRQEVRDSVVTASTLAGGQVMPIVIEPRATVYRVVYRYSEKGSADKFAAFLKAYGITDFEYRFVDSTSEHVLFMGRYTEKADALSRIAFLNQTTRTSNATLIERDLE